VDELKYVLTAIAPESKDSEFTWKEYQTRVNSELADIFGNFVNRTLVLTNKYFDGVVPAPFELEEVDKQVLVELKEIPNRISNLVYAYKLRDAQAEMMQIARIGNKYLADQEPWKLIKTNPERVQTIMYIALQITAKLTLASAPFLPDTSIKLQTILKKNWSDWNDLLNDELLSPGHLIGETMILFPKIEDALVDTELEKLHQTNENKSNYPPMKEMINFDDFSKLDLRLGTISHAEKVEKADKLLKLTVSTGIDERTIVSGIAEHYKPEEVIGKTVLVLLNLEPRKIRGIESQGMILMAENEEGTLSFLAPEKAFEAGPTVR
jgi:methionyl-tRNA synthetase